MSIWNFMLSWVEHEKSFITSAPGLNCSYKPFFMLNSHNQFICPGHKFQNANNCCWHFLKFMSRTNGMVYCSEQGNRLINFYFDNYEDSENHAQVSWTWKCFITLGLFSYNKKNKCAWSGNIKITHRRPTHGTARKNHRTLPVTRH